MIIFGHTPREWKRRAKEHKWFIGALLVAFVLRRNNYLDGS